MDPATIALLFSVAREGLTLVTQATEMARSANLPINEQQQAADIAALKAHARLVSSIAARLGEPA